MQPGLRYLNASVSADIGMPTGLASLVLQSSAPFTVVLMWTAIGHGLRFGPGYLILSVVLSAFGVLAGIIFSDYWATELVTAWLGVAHAVGGVTRIHRASRAEMMRSPSVSSEYIDCR